MNTYEVSTVNRIKGLHRYMSMAKRYFPTSSFSLWLARHIMSNPAYLFKNAVLNPPLSAIAVEINSFCNRKCRFCPNFDHVREEAFLDEALFYAIVEGLKKMKFRGSFTFNMYNEPLLDKRLIKFIGFVRNELPAVYMYINTNGDLLDMPLWTEMRKAGLDFINITQYDGQVNRNIREILERLDLSEKKFFHVHPLDYICNRAGLVKTGQGWNPAIKSSCPLPFCQLNINYKGKAVLCCNDYLGLVEAGDLRKESILDIWGNEVFRNYRKRLFLKGRAHLKLCETCDMESRWQGR